jgi:quinol monooxygenase YgiN
MSTSVILIDTSDVRPGKLEELKAAINDLVEFVEANEPRPRAYSIYLDPAGRQMTVIQVHPDSASLELHMAAAGPKFARFADLVKLSRVDVYGRPSSQVIEQLRRKAEMLGGAGLFHHTLQAGFVRAGIPI